MRLNVGERVLISALMITLLTCGVTGTLGVEGLIGLAVLLIIFAGVYIALSKR